MSTRSEARRLLPLALFVAVAASAGCAVGPDYIRPTTVSSEKWQHIEPWREATPSDALPRSAWWTIFKDEELNGLENDLLAANQTLKAAVATLDQARASAAVQNAALFPSLTVAPSAGFERYSGNRPTGTTAPLRPITQGNFLLPFTVGYEVDLFGSVRRSIEAAQASYQASGADLENVRLVLTAEMAADYFTLRQLDAEIDVLDRSVENLRRGLELVKSRHQGGVASGLDVAQEETLLDSTRTQATLLLAQRKQYEDAIAVLAGRPAPDFRLASRVLDAEPPLIDAGLPSDLLERRPDIARAERTMAAANAEIGVATAAFYPSITLGGQAGWNSTRIEQLFNPVSAFWAAAASIAQTVFDGGAKTAQLKYARAGYESVVASYRGTVLNAFREVQDSIVGLQVLESAQRSQDEAVASARRQLDLANNRYAGGVVSYLDVVTAQQTLLTNAQQDAVIRGQRLVTAVALVKALGGGWDASSVSQLHASARAVDAFLP